MMNYEFHVPRHSEPHRGISGECQNKSKYDKKILGLYLNE